MPPDMRVTLDSNVWEKIFDPADRDGLSIRFALANERMKGFICEAGFRIEAIRKDKRAAYFAEPALEAQFPFNIEIRDGRPYVRLITMGPDDKRHPGLPDIQSKKLKDALAAGVRLMRGAAWMGLPAPQEIRDPTLFVQTTDARPEREQCQIEVLARIEARGVGKAAFDAAGGWNTKARTMVNEKLFRKACAEWADGELVAAHIAYQNDILCTNDRARSAGASIFDSTNRAWLTAEFGVRFATFEELVEKIAA
jgi:hypothetical protein